MACFRPIRAFQLDDGKIVFHERGAVKRPLTLPCGSCRGCLYVRARSWAIRCMCESRLYDNNMFLTLTYNDDCIPNDFGLHYRDFQLFVKRLRKLANFRFFCCGEYGDRFKRPHFHALIFGYVPSDLKVFSETGFTSKLIDSVWSNGNCVIDSLTYASAGYVAQYCTKSLGHKVHTERYRRVDADTGESYQVAREFARMSRRPGIGYMWFQKYWRDVYLARDGVVLPGGKLVPPPRYFDDLLARSAPNVRDDKEFDRYLNSCNFVDDCTPERLLAREKCLVARLDRNSRRVE